MSLNHQCLICLGSNCDAAVHLADALESISGRLRVVWCGNPVRTPDVCRRPAVSDFLNQALLVECQEDVVSLNALLKSIERENGRTPDSKRSGIVPLDIDLLTCDGTVLKPEEMVKRHVVEATRGLEDALAKG